MHPRLQAHHLPDAVFRPSGALISAPEFRRRDLLEMVMISRPDVARAALPFNASLPEDLWMKLYTFRPKPALTQALALTAHPLSEKQLEHLRREKRPQVWAHVMATTILEPEFVTFLASTNRLDSRLRLPRTPFDSVFLRRARVVTRLTDETASEWGVGMLRNLTHRGSSVNYLLEKVEPVEAWEILLRIVDDFEGSLADLVAVSLSLSATSA